VPQLNWLVIGIGDITTKRVIPAILAEARSRLAGLVTRHPEKGRAYPDVPVWTDLSEAVSDAAIDAVYVASPVFLHAPQSIAALRAGKHVLCEKPMALNYDQGSQMVRVARECGTTFGVIAKGAIGRPVLAEVNCHNWFVDADGRRSWLLDPVKSGGGPLYDIASHRIDVLNYVFGRPERVCAMLSNAVHQTAVEDCATVLIEYESKVRGIVDVRWHSHVTRDGCRIIGTEGEIEMSPLTAPTLVSPEGTESLPAHPNLHYPCIENFVSAVLDGTPLLATGATSLWTDWVMERARTGT
jgi:1,5-anhydro-D-fructose reductase (1,5-anhydro-D-mannitol-forming)